ncbi:ABC transporter ATP-binding protein [Mesorhizobium hawassense]|uniref:ABC transporter ATP-binding protein n=1 Tax=Mesorhizobium hawassense TaxID=1209954 RepID=A0A330HJE0_9HYPH|nr:ABC transporter ATP-binding protein [Mesorhizobium hawassense]RAZ84777.1 ABC transporter ATP-binding protein [Mesorhizobium hawassense]
MKEILEIKCLSRRFGGLQAVNKCEFSVRAHSITGLVGPNGAGKSTLFNLVSGFVRPDSGEIRFAGERIDTLSAHSVARLGLRRTFQIPRELKQMTVLENLLLVPENQFGDRIVSVLSQGKRVREEEGKNLQIARGVLEMVGLSEKATHQAALLSGGQKKLLELARCLMAKPKLLLLDEPTAGVNPTLIRHLMSVLRRVNESGVTLLIIEHNMTVIMELCERVIVMDRGQVIAAGSPSAIQSNKQVLEAYLGGVSA